MYSVTIKDHIMIAHSMNGQIFGPAQNLHGATYVVEVTFRSPQLDENQIVIDIGLAGRILKKALSPLNYQNLDAMNEFKGQNTTTEYLAKYIHDKIRDQLPASFYGRVSVILHESPSAKAGYAGHSPEKNK